MPHENSPAATDASGKPVSKPCPDMVVMTADITILADGRHWKRGTIIKDPKVIAELYAIGGPGMTFYEEI